MTALRSDEEYGWPFRAYSIKVTIHATTEIACYTTAKPFKTTADDALAKLEEFKSGIMARVEGFVVGGRLVTPITCYDRRAGGEIFTQAANYYPRVRNRNNDIVDGAKARIFYPVISEIILPPAILANNIVNVQLIEELQHDPD